MNLKKIGKIFTSRFVGTGPSSFKKIICWAAVSQKLINTAVRQVNLRDYLQDMLFSREGLCLWYVFEIGEYFLSDT